MKNKSFARFSFLLSCVALVSLSFLSCTDILGARDNPVDLKGTAYQGFETVTNPEAVVPSSSDYGTSPFMPTLRANRLVGAEVYRFQIAATADFAVVLYTSDETPSNIFVPSDWTGFNMSTPYYWRVQVKSSGTWTDWSAAVCSFSIGPSDFGSIKPGNGTTITDTTPALDWGDIDEASGYEVQLASTSSGIGSATPISTTSSNYQFTTGLEPGTWYWRVRAKNADNACGAWSATQSFTIEPLSMINVNGGTFNNGTANMTVSDFAIGKYEVTFAQYDAFCDATLRTKPGDQGWGRSTRPVINVSWYDAVAFCNWLSAEEGLTPAYTGSGTSWTLDRTRNGYRLPTEAEWQFAARGGNSTNNYTYSGSNTIGDIAWYDANSGSKTQPVGTKAGNELGLYDMSGNVWEWNHDWYGTNPASAQTDYTGLSSGTNRVDRGGGWNNESSICTVSFRDFQTPTLTNYAYGFRVARTLTNQAVTFDEVAQVGGVSGTTTTTGLTLSFSADPTTLTADYITVTGATKGALTGTGTSRSLLISDITVANGETVSVAISNPAGFEISGSPRTAVVYKVFIEIVSIPGGTFNNGTANMTVSDFAIGKYEVTFAQYDAFCDATSRTKPGDEGYGRSTRPVINVSWYDALAFCNWLSAEEGLTAAYNGSGTSWTLDRTRNGYRLPTEAEWQFAARGGSLTNNYTYSGSNTIGDVAWYYDNSGTKTQPVGTKAGNELGLYDMSGNVREWNHDWYGSYPGSAQTNYTGPSSGTVRGTRGGFWNDNSNICSVSERGADYPTSAYYAVGFRVARTLTNQAVTFDEVTQVGGVSGTTTTTGLTLSFSIDPATLTAAHITVTGATKGALTGTSTSRSLGISNITVANGETVSVAVSNPAGFDISGSPRTAVVYKAPVAVTFSGVTQVGGTSNAVTTTGLTLSFSADPTTLTADHITVTGATKGALTGSGTSRSLAISNITVANGETVSVAVSNPAGYTITGSPQTAVVYKNAPLVNMVDITGGIFNNGTASMTVSNFAIGKYEVTFAQYDAFCDATSRTKPGDEGWGRSTRPAINVSWYDAVAFCNWLSVEEGLTAAYTGSGTSWTLDRTRNGYRLPTEAEWQFAARGGNSTNNYSYAGSNTIGDVAWYSLNSGSRTQPVGTKAGNELGLFDMSGNVWEWNHDWSGSYPGSAQTDYTGLSSGTSRVRRGGSWYLQSYNCTVSERDDFSPSYMNDSLGFRVACTLPDLAITFSGVSQVGGTDNAVTTTGLTLSFSADPTTLTADHITVAGATKGALTGSGTSRSLAISSITIANGETVSVALSNPAGFEISGSPKAAVVYKAPVAVAFSGVTQVGGTSNAVTTTGLTLSFSADPTTLTADLITVTGATKGVLTGTGTSRSLGISDIIVANGETVSVAIDNPNGFEISGSPRMAVVYRKAPLENMIDVTGDIFNNGTASMTVSNFAIGKYEVTFAQYDAFCDATSRTKPGDQGWGRSTRPVINVSWYDAVAFCNWLSVEEGLTPAYTGSGTSWTLDRTRNGYRLPTEAEWQFAAQGGNLTNNYTYSGSNTIGDVAWYEANSGSNTQPVGTKAGNELGLHDMSGNVWEWNHDWYGSYPGSAQTDYTGLSSGTQRVLRGGSWSYSSSYCTVSYRNIGGPTAAVNFVGFRVARTLPDLAITFSGVTQVGGTSNSVNTTSLTLSFSVDPTTLTADHITVTGATKGALTGTGTSRSLGISNFTVANGETVSVAVSNPAGFEISGSPKAAVIYKAPVAVTFSGVSQVGGTSNTVTTTGLTLSFSVDPTTLTADHITVTGATKGALTGTGTSRSLAISSITVANGATVLVEISNPNGFTISGSPKTAVVYKKAPPVISMVSVTGGTFNNSTANMTVSNFAIGKYEVTFAQYDAFCDATSRTKPGDSGWGRSTRPVINVTWYDAVAFCNWLSAEEGLTAAYTGSGTSWTLDRTRNGYRLPTEAEWQFAARGGNSTNNYSYAGSNTIGGVAWYDANSGSKTQPVGTKAGNELGLFDMSGNVWEWNHDWYGSYPGSAQTNYTGLTSGTQRVFRGGSWFSLSSDCSVSYRVGIGPAYALDTLGFRVARTL